MDIDKAAVTKFVNYIFSIDEEKMLIALDRLIGIKNDHDFFKFVLEYLAYEKVNGTNNFKLPEEAPMLNMKQWEEYKVEIGTQIIEELASRGKIDERDTVILGKRLRGEPVVRVVK